MKHLPFLLITVIILQSSCNDATNLPPVFMDQSFTVSENITHETIIGSLNVTDPEGDSIIFELTDNSNDLFDLSELGILRLQIGKKLDFETQTIHPLLVTVSDGLNEVSAVIEIIVEDGLLIIFMDQSFSVSETITHRDRIGDLVAIDPEERPIIFHLTNNPDGKFSLTSEGSLSLKSGVTLDFETQSIHRIEVTVTYLDISNPVTANIDILVEDGPDPFICTLTKDPAGTVRLSTWCGDGPEQFDCNFQVNWRDGVITSHSGNDASLIEHTYDSPGLVRIEISGDLAGLFSLDFRNRSITSIHQWGSNQWKTMNYALAIEGLNIEAPDTPDLSRVTDMESIFDMDCVLWKAFNVDLTNWNVSNVANMSRAFFDADSFNGDITDWDVSNVTDMSKMFHSAATFDQDLSGWDVSNVTDMSEMFLGASLFDQDLSGWDVSNVTQCRDFATNSGLSQEHLPNFKNCD